MKKRKKEVAAYEFWQWIKRQHPFECEIEKVIVDGEDLTELVKELENTPFE